MTVGETFTCAVDSVAYGGDGIARIDGFVVFIPGVLPHETIKIRMTQVKKRFARAVCIDILSPSPHRIAPCCQIPGCVYDHIAYPAEVELKQQQLGGFFRKLTDFDPARFASPFASPLSLHYRNKIVLHAVPAPGGFQLGYRREPSHDVQEIQACPLACAAINDRLAAFRASAPFDRVPLPCDVTFRHTAHDGALCWFNGRPPENGAPFLTETSPVGPLRVPYDGFYQVNPHVGEALVRTVTAWFAEDSAFPDILDLYCGVGVFGLACMRAGGTRLTGIESGRQAVAAARLNAADHGIPAVFQCRRLGNGPHELRDLRTDSSRTTVLVDPPREGLALEMTRWIIASGLRRLFYISCDPATLTRDLNLLLAEGFRITRARLFDMFPRTAHFETLVELRRNG